MRSIPEAPAAQLTTRQREILAFVNDHSAQHGYPPTVREIGSAVGLTSSSTVHAHLANLERLGLLRRDPAKPRALNLVGRSTKGPPAQETAGIRMLPLLGQIAAGAPLLAPSGLELAGHGEPAPPQGLERDRHRGRRQAGGGGEIIHRHRARDVEMPLREGNRRLVRERRRVPVGRHARGKFVIGHESGAGEKGLDLGSALGGRPQHI